MILLDAKTETHKGKAPNFLSLLGSDVDEKGKPKLSFLELLKGIELNEIDDVIKFIPLDEQISPKDIKDTKLPLKTSNIELNPLITKDISPKDLKALVADAKNYLKTKITQSSDYKIHETKSLPKTLKGLVEIANKLGLDIKKITLEDVQPAKHAKVLDPKQIDVKDIKQEPKAEIKTTPIEFKGELKQEVKSEIKIAPQNSKQEITQEHKIEVKPEIKTSPIEAKATPIVNKTDIKEQKQDVITNVKEDIKQDVKSETKSSLPLFKELLSTPQKVSTQHIIDVKHNLISKETNKDVKISLPVSRKQKADETLKLLLRGEKPQQSLNTSLTSDFSVASARVIAPTATTDISRSLESLLQNKSSTNTSLSKDGDDMVGDLDSMKTHKADSFVVKLNEAKQMIKYLSQDVKTAIDDYKSPFSRLKVQLNPQNLGEIDLTIVSRGKNLHVNISSNNVAINALAMNVNDLKTQLNNNGINNATLNFNSGSGGEQQSQDSRQHHQNQQQQAGDEYNYFDNEEKNEEVLTSLEIVVPSYA